MSRATTAIRALAIATGLAVAVPALAQDGTRVSRTVTTAAPTAPASARDDAAKTMPTYEAFGSGDTESTSETFFRLSRDFASMSEIGTRRLGAVPVWPRGDMKFGPFRILPYVREGAEWVSNFYRVNRTGDYGSGNANDASFTHTNQVGAMADTTLAGGRLRLAASIDAEWDVRYDDGNDDRGVFPGTPIRKDEEKADTFEFDGQLGASYRWPAGLYVRGGVAYERRADPIDVEVTREFQRTNRRSFLTWGLDRDILFGSKFRFEMGATVRDTIGRETGLEDMDRTETTYYFKASYPFLRETTRLFGRARWRQDERESNRINDGDTIGFDAGIEGSIPLREGEYRGLRGQVSVGFDSALYEDQNFQNGSATVIRDENRRNTNLAVSAALQYMASRKSTFDLRYLRTNQFSFHGNYQVTDRFDFTFSHNLTQTLTGRVQTFFEYSDPAGRTAQQVVGFPDSSSDYPNTTRFGAGLGVRYKLNEWLDADASYDWERRNNRISGFVNHRVTAGLTLYLSGLKARPRDDGGMPVSSSYSAPSPTYARSSGPAAAPAVSAAAPVTDKMTISGGSLTDGGKVLRVTGAGERATITLPGGSTVEVTGPAVVQIVEVGAAGSRIQLVSGAASARVGASALEIQSGTGASLVLQNAAASATVGAGRVSFTKTAGDYAKVYDAGKVSDLSGTWSK